jgi:hypothetical protein
VSSETLGGERVTSISRPFVRFACLPRGAVYRPDRLRTNLSCAGGRPSVRARPLQARSRAGLFTNLLWTLYPVFIR